MIFFQTSVAELLYSTGLFAERGILLYGVVDALLFIVLLVLVWLVYLICHRVIAQALTGFFQRSENTWDDELIESRIVRRMTRFIPTLLLWWGTPVVLRNKGVQEFVQSCFSVLLIIITLTVLFSVVNTFLRLYRRREISKEVPLQGVGQTVKIILSIGACILVLSVVLGKSPALIFSGFGALTAIMMLVFKDPILGLAAGIQLSSNKMIAVGDWIEVPKYGADGTVLDLALTTVKVQNWDKTITTIPTYALISDSFKNWRGMSESGVRRIKRSINLDLHSIRFLEEEEIDQLAQMPLLQDYLTEKRREIGAGSNADNPQHQRRLTNLGTYRAYLYAYLKAHVKVSEDATQLVRQLQPTTKGIPLEVYMFSSDNRWVEYENLQSDLFDHFISILPEFHLKLYQEPTGEDFRALSS